MSAPKLYSEGKGAPANAAAPFVLDQVLAELVAAKVLLDAAAKANDGGEYATFDLQKRAREAVRRAIELMAPLDEDSTRNMLIRRASRAERRRFTGEPVTGFGAL